MKRSLLGLLTAMVLGITAVGVTPALAAPDAPTQMQVEKRKDGDGDKKHKDGDHKKDNDKGKKHGDGRHHDDDDNDCFGLVVICIG